MSELTLQEEVESYRQCLEEGLAKICDALGIDTEYYDRDQADIACYMDCFNDAAELLKKSGFQYDGEDQLFKKIQRGRREFLLRMGGKQCFEVDCEGYAKCKHCFSEPPLTDTNNG